MKGRAYTLWFLNRPGPAESPGITMPYRFPIVYYFGCTLHVSSIHPVTPKTQCDTQVVQDPSTLAGLH